MTRTWRLAVTLAIGGWALAGSACSPEGDTGVTDGGGGDRGDTSGCSGSSLFCSTDGRMVLRCNASGSAEVVQTCPTGQACRLGGCVASVCTPGQSTCLDSATQHLCRPDGSGWDDSTCADGQNCNPDTGLCSAACKVRMFVLLDRSGSMGDETPTKWQQAHTALDALLASDAAADMEFGLGSFPTDGSCGVDGMISYAVPDATSGEIDTFFRDNSANGSTPLSAALDSFTTDTSANLADPSYHNAILVVSDGMDTCLVDCNYCLTDPHPFACMTSCENDSEATTADALTATTQTLRDSLQIRTYVIGIGSDADDVELTAIASNGGTAIGHWIQASNVDDLTAALQTVINEMAECNPIFGK